MKAFNISKAISNSHYRKVATHFSKAALHYEEAAHLQRQVGHELLQQISLSKAPHTILDVGCSTGYFARELGNLFPTSELYLLDASMDMLKHAKLKAPAMLICANMEELPFDNQSIDLVFANMSLQWSSNFSANLAEINRILTPDGTCLFSIPGPLSLIELKRSWQAVDETAHVNDFQSMLSTQHALQNSGFKNISLQDKIVQLEYPSVIAMMQQLKATGADCVLEQRHTLTGKTKFRQMTHHYEQLRKANNFLPCTYDIIFGQAQR